MVKRSGNVLPPPADDLYNSTSSFSDKSTIRSGISVSDTYKLSLDFKID